MTTVFVNIYNEGRAFGGPEEGGWYYDYGEPKESLKSECTCPLDDVLTAEWNEELEEMDYLFDEYPLQHKEECPSRILYEQVKKARDNGQKAAFLASYVTSNGTWDPNGMDDAPSEYSGERITGGKIVIKIQPHKGKDYPEYQPRWE